MCWTSPTLPPRSPSGQLDSQACSPAPRSTVSPCTGLVAVAIQASPTDKGRVALTARPTSRCWVASRSAPCPTCSPSPRRQDRAGRQRGRAQRRLLDRPRGLDQRDDVSTPRPRSRSAGFAAYNGQEKALRAQGVRASTARRASRRGTSSPSTSPCSPTAPPPGPRCGEQRARPHRRATATVEDPAARRQGPRSECERARSLRHRQEGRHPGLAGRAASTCPTRSPRIPTRAAPAGHRQRGRRARPGARVTTPTGMATPARAVEEFRVKHLTNAKGWSGRRATTCRRNSMRSPAAACSTRRSSPTAARSPAARPVPRRHDQLGRLNITWTMGYRQDADGSRSSSMPPAREPGGTRLMYDTLTPLADARSRSATRTASWCGTRAPRSSASSPAPSASSALRGHPCATWFNANHEEGDTLDNRSDNKVPEPKASRSDASATRPSPSSASSAWAACWCMTSPTRRRRRGWTT